ncbi:MAG: serine hydrolase, partial [Rhodoferax sp.]|nr:serine hydrolase [Rhodoferax sp.]
MVQLWRGAVGRTFATACLAWLAALPAGSLARDANANANANVGGAAPAAWVTLLQAELARIEAEGQAGLGVLVRDLATGEEASHRSQETWYLAS